MDAQRSLFGEHGDERPGDVDGMARKHASDVLGHGEPGALLAFASAMGVRGQLDAAMDAYNAGIAGNAFAIPYASIETFAADPGVRAALAAAYNDKRNGRSATYADALAGRRIEPRKPPMRGMGEAFRIMASTKAARDRRMHG